MIFWHDAKKNLCDCEGALRSIVEPLNHTEQAWNKEKDT